MAKEGGGGGVAAAETAATAGIIVSAKTNRIAKRAEAKLRIFSNATNSPPPVCQREALISRPADEHPRPQIYSNREFRVRDAKYLCAVLFDQRSDSELSAIRRRARGGHRKVPG
jgi:hypothetical protein